VCKKQKETLNGPFVELYIRFSSANKRGV